MILDTIDLRILEEFTGDYSARLTGSQIAKKKSLNQKTVANKLSRLEERNFFKSTMQGRNKLYFLNTEDKEKIIHFLSITEHTRTIEFYEKNPMIKEIAEHLPDIPAMVFGSYAKGIQKKDSDLDLFAVSKVSNPEIFIKLGQKYRLDINASIYPDLTKSNILIEEIRKHHIILSNTEYFVKAFLEMKND